MAKNKNISHLGPLPQDLHYQERLTQVIASPGSASLYIGRLEYSHRVLQATILEALEIFQHLMHAPGEANKPLLAKELDAIQTFLNKVEVVQTNAWL